MQHQATEMAELIRLARKQGYKNLDALTAVCKCGATLVPGCGIIHYEWCRDPIWGIELKPVRNGTKWAG